MKYKIPKKLEENLIILEDKEKILINSKSLKRKIVKNNESNFLNKLLKFNYRFKKVNHPGFKEFISHDFLSFLFANHLFLKLELLTPPIILTILMGK